MGDVFPLTPLTPFLQRSMGKISFLMRACCIFAFLGGSLIPLHAPRTISNVDAATYLTEEQFLLVEEGFVMKTASISEQGRRLAYSRAISHTVGEAENLTSIAGLYGISVDTIRWGNDLEEGMVIHPGDVLLILPVDGVLHTVTRGQSLLKIAALYDVDVERITSQNQIRGEKIYAGQQIIIPGGRPLVFGKQRAPARPVEGAVPPRPTPAPEASAPPSFGILQKPCDCTYTQYYHGSHFGVDLARNGGGPIFAAEDGIVIRADYGWNGGYGNVVEIDHGNGLITLYAHNRELHIREGAAVRRGDVIASMGKTGRVYGKTGVHLHFEVIQNGVKKNALLYLQ